MKYSLQTGGTGVHDTVVNQLLSKIDGVDQLNNILLIGKLKSSNYCSDKFMILLACLWTV